MPKKRQYLELSNVQYAYPDEPEKLIVKGTSLSLSPGKIIALLGKNGCGKTTLLNLIAGFQKPSSGRIDYLQNTEGKRMTSMVFQQTNLLDWKTVAENIELPLISIIQNKQKRRILVNKAIKLLKIENYENKLPKQLSGGTKQRVEIARALVSQPKILLLDEPFSSLDPSIKFELMKEIRKLIIKDDRITVFVTHDLDEARLFADEILVMDSQRGKMNPVDKSKISLQEHLLT